MDLRKTAECIKNFGLVFLQCDKNVDAGTLALQEDFEECSCPGTDFEIPSPSLPEELGALLLSRADSEEPFSASAKPILHFGAFTVGEKKIPRTSHPEDQTNGPGSERLTTPQYHIGDEDGPATRRRALLLHCLGPEGQRIFDALPAPPPPQPPLSTEATEKQMSAHTAAASPPDPYDVAVDTLAHYFTATVNVRVERHHFRERRQLSGKELRCLHTVVRRTSASASSTLPATSSDAQGRIPPQGAIVEQPQSEPKFGMPALLWARFSHLFTPDVICQKAGCDQAEALNFINRWLPGSGDRCGGRKRRFRETFVVEQPDDPHSQSADYLSAARGSWLPAQPQQPGP
ncbi:hypothetical protein MRX96_027894 [Rhipicephalus microplus]